MRRWSSRVQLGRLGGLRLTPASPAHPSGLSWTQNPPCCEPPSCYRTEFKLTDLWGAPTYCTDHITDGGGRGPGRTPTLYPGGREPFSLPKKAQRSEVGGPPGATDEARACDPQEGGAPRRTVPCRPAPCTRGQAQTQDSGVPPAGPCGQGRGQQAGLGCGWLACAASGEARRPWQRWRAGGGTPGSVRLRRGSSARLRC